MAHDADIFVVAGTSLLVYPAAGLIHYAGSQIPKFILDKKIPDTPEIYNLVKIEKPATEGVAELISMLEKQS
jgi:NAD-dependent deacetylase